MAELLDQLPPYQFLIAFSQLISRICHPNGEVLMLIQVGTHCRSVTSGGKGDLCAVVMWVGGEGLDRRKLFSSRLLLVSWAGGPWSSRTPPLMGFGCVCCSCLPRGTQAIILKLIKHYPQQSLWMMMAVIKVKQWHTCTHNTRTQHFPVLLPHPSLSQPTSTDKADVSASSPKQRAPTQPLRSRL